MVFVTKTCINRFNKSGWSNNFIFLSKNVLLKNVLIIAFLILNAIASATDYYISSSGNDSNNGLSASTPWQTIAKVNAAFPTLIPGDRILFNRGDTFYGTIIVTKSGAAGSPITIGAYGTGEKPVITGFTTISGWTNEGNGIYSKVITSEAQTNMVTIDGVNKGMGRYPDSTYLTYESFSTNISITDNGLGDATNWTGAEAVIRKNDWTLDRCTITNHTGDVLTYTSLGSNQNATANYGYFIQNDLRCVTVYGEWYHDTVTEKFYMYFGGVDPTTKTVKVATINNLVYNNKGNVYITIENITFIGSINTLADISFGSDHWIIQNCSLGFGGEDGIRYSGSYGTIDNNSVNNCNRTGIGIFYSGTNNVITNNGITNIGIVIGLSMSIPSIWSPTCGIAVEYTNCLVQYNSITNVGYNGIQMAGLSDNELIKNNFINNICLVLNDGGGIYTSSPHTSIIIDGNVILNSIGNIKGTTDNKSLAEGIYLDEFTSNITIRNNTIANCFSNGIKLHKAHDNIIQNNIAYNNSNGIGFENWSGVTAIYNNKLNGNIFFAKAPIQLVLSFNTTVNEIPGFGTADNNYYARPVDDNNIIYTNQPSTGPENRTLAEWQSFTKQDANSHKSPVSIADTSLIHFYYNATQSNRFISLAVPMIDVNGTKYVNNITLLPFTSVVLIVDPNPTNQPPVVEISNPLEGDKYETNSTITLEAVASDPDGSISNVEFYNGPIKLIELTSAPFIYTWKNVASGSYSITALATDNLNITATSLPVEFEVGTFIKNNTNSDIINLYPNPNNGHFSIEFINPPQNEKSNILVTDLAGKEVYNGTVLKEETLKQFDLSKFKSGIYVMTIKDKEILVMKKIIIQ
jgi:parallel beta-helix repeat protein